MFGKINDFYFCEHHLYMVKFIKSKTSSDYIEKQKPSNLNNLTESVPMVSK